MSKASKDHLRTATLGTLGVFDLGLKRRVSLLIYHRDGVEAVPLAEGQGVLVGRGPGLHQRNARGGRAGHHPLSGAPRSGRGPGQLGVKIVKEMNKVGMVVDISHVSDATFWHSRPTPGAG